MAADIVVLVILLLSFAMGYGRGLIRSLIGIAGNLLALGLAFFLAKPVSIWSGEHFGAVSALSLRLQKVLPLPDELDLSLASPEGVSALYMYLKALPLPQGLTQNLVQSVQDNVHSLSQGIFRTMGEAISLVVAEYIWQGIVFVLLWAVLTLLLSLICRMLIGLVHRIPVVGTLDRVVGGIATLGLAALTLAVLYQALGVLVGLKAADNVLLSSIGASHILPSLQGILQSIISRGQVVG